VYESLNRRLWPRIRENQSSIAADLVGGGSLWRQQQLQIRCVRSHPVDRAVITIVFVVAASLRGPTRRRGIQLAWTAPKLRIIAMIQVPAWQQREQIADTGEVQTGFPDQPQQSADPLEVARSKVARPFITLYR
jgi:hypothetical protein